MLTLMNDNIFIRSGASSIGPGNIVVDSNDIKHEGMSLSAELINLKSKIDQYNRIFFTDPNPHVNV